MCVCVCVYIYIYIEKERERETAYELPLVPNSTAVKHFYTNRERCDALTGYLSLGRRPGGHVTLDSTFYNVLSKPEIIAAPSYCDIFFLLAFLEDFIRNIIIILYINSTI